MSRHRSNSSSSIDEDEADIELPRLEDSRTSLLQLPQLDLPPFDLLLMLPDRRTRRAPLLSSTMMQESGLDQDCHTASSNDFSGRLSEKLNNAKLSLLSGVSAVNINTEDAKNAAEGGSSSSSGSEVADAVADAVADEGATDASIPSNLLEDGTDAEDSAPFDSESQPDASPSSHDLQAPRLRILHSDDSDSDEHQQAPLAPLARSEPLFEQQPQPPPPQPLQPQRMLGLLQVCCLALEVLSDGGLLSDDARRWLTPELLCDKLCDRLARPLRQPAAAAAAPSLTSSMSSASLSFGPAASAASSESPTTRRVRLWLKASAAAVADGTHDDSPPGGAPLKARRANYSV